MLNIVIPSVELWDEKNEQFIHTKERKLQLEHSLVSVAKWEAKWNKPFINKKEKTTAEIIDYVRCMTITQNVPDDCYNYLTIANIEEVNMYIALPMTATWFTETKKKITTNREQITAELIYYWMISFNIPMECQKWHLNRLLTLIRVFNEKNQPKKKMSQQELYRQHAAINAANRKRFHSKG